MSTWKNQHGITILRLHYSADPDKGEGETTFVPEINKHLSPWALTAYGRMTDPTLYLKEYEIDAEATLGALLFQFHEEVTVEPVRDIPPEWTRRMAVDPHPGIPHAFLWCATDQWGDRWYYRELWPSKVCYEWRQGILHGKPGPCPQDERGPNIQEYAQTIKYLESAENPENRKGKEPFDEEIFGRVIDYAARAFGKGTNDDPEQENYQQRYEKHLAELEAGRPYFDDAKKDRQVGVELVNEGLKVIERMGNSGKYEKASRIHILGDRCPELIHQLKSNRRQQLKPIMLERQDPTGKPVKVRNHMTDNLRYIEMSNPIYIEREPDHAADFRPMARGFSY
ncbi:MAG TPA: hypothetical protein VGG59_06110 [Acidobacteriaceae bacterium]|jgi:hypothetical protein